MVKIYIQTTHSKLIYEDDKEAREILLTKFIAEDKSLLHDPRVKNGYMSPNVNFYSEEHDILPTGLLPYVYRYFDKAGVLYENIDLREFPPVNKAFLKKLINDEIAFDNDGIIYKPRDYQIEAIKAMIKHKGGVIKLSTGSGKGLLAALFCHIYSKSKVLFIFDKIDLVHQTYKEFINKYQIEEKRIGIIQGDNYKYGKDTNIILLSMQSYEKAFHIFPQVKVIISDECHTTGRTETAQKIIYSCQKASMHIGLSATPDVIENPVEQLRLYSIMGPIIYKKEIREQIDSAVLSDTRVELHRVNMPESDRPEIVGSYADVYEKFKISKAEIYEAIKENNIIQFIPPDKTMLATEYDKLFRKAWLKLSDEDKEEAESEAIDLIVSKWCEDDPENNSFVIDDGVKYLRRFMGLGDESTHYVFNNIRNQMIADIAREKNKRTLIIFSKIKHGEELLKLLPEAKLVHGEHSLKEREVAEYYLKDNEHAIVISSNIWSTGKDIPEIEVFINAGAGVSKIQQIQKMGRATRLSPKSGKEEAVIVDFMDVFSKLGLKQSIKRMSTYKSLNIKLDTIGE